MIYAIYIVLSLAINIIFAVNFNESLHISFIPLLFIAYMVLMSIYHYNNRAKGDFNVNNFSDLTEEEWSVVSLYMSRSLVIFIPFNFPLIFFFNIYIKLIAFILIIFLAYACGPVVYKIKNKK